MFVVDDDAPVRDAVQLLLRLVGLASKAYASADEFLAAFDPNRPGCLVLDVRMSGTSGLELQEILKDRKSSIPIIFLTAHGDIELAVKAVKAGALDFIQKPFRDQALIDKVRCAIAQDASHRARLAEAAEIQSLIESLTPRERRLLEMVIAGIADKAIASERTTDRPGHC